MLKQDAKDKLKALGFDVDKLIAAITHAEDQDFTVPDGKLYADADLEARDNNTRKEGKKEGKKEGIGIAGKTIAEKFGLKDIDTNDPDKIFEALNANFQKGDNGLKEQVRLLQEEVTSVKADRDAKIKQVNDATFERDLVTHFPKNRLDIMSDADYMQLVKNRLQFEDSDGIKVVKRNGEILRDPTTKNPLAISDAINSLFTESKWIGSDNGSGGGRGGNDNQNNSTGGIKKYSQFEEKWVKEHNGNEASVMTADFQTALMAHAKATTDFDMKG